MRVTELWEKKTSPTISFELYPPRTEKAAVKLDNTIDLLADLDPDFVSVTFGAGGSTREGSRDLIKTLFREKELNVIAYFSCYGLAPGEIDQVLDEYQSLGIETLLAVRGDQPEDESFRPHPESFPYASDLVAYIRPRYDFCLGVAGYPEGHIDAPSLDSDMEYLKLKLDLGAEYVITNYFYDNRFFFEFLDRCGAFGINVPILPGIMPVYSVKMMEMLAGLCGATITKPLREGIETLPEGDPGGLIQFGIDFALQQCEELLDAGVPGLHIYTMDLSKSSIGLIEGLRASGKLSSVA
jgi:methylenetetrahydrofolate reductase (NADPH)